MRLFAAIPIPEHLHTNLRLLQGGLPGASWRPDVNFHLTLQFFGDVADSDFEALAQALDEVAFDPMDLQVNGLGAFGRKAPFAVWAGVDGGEALGQLASDCAWAAKRAGQPMEMRKFTPHITLAYCEGTSHSQAAQWMAAHDGYAPFHFTATDFALYSSHLGKGPSVYREEICFPAENAD